MSNQNVPSERHAWRLKDHASAYGLSVSFLRKEIRAGRLAAKKAGTAVLVLDRDFLGYLEGSAGEGNSDEIGTGPAVAYQTGRKGPG